MIQSCVVKYSARMKSTLPQSFSGASKTIGQVTGKKKPLILCKLVDYANANTTRTKYNGVNMEPHRAYTSSQKTLPFSSTPSGRHNNYYIYTVINKYLKHNTFTHKKKKKRLSAVVLFFLPSSQSIQCLNEKMKLWDTKL